MYVRLHPYVYESLWYIGSLVVLFIAYKLYDRVLRWPLVEQIGNRYVLITGCDTGFGHKAARHLDRLGCHVFAGCLTESGQNELIRHSSKRLRVLELDVADHDSVLRALAYVKSKLPNGMGLWGVVNNAGVLGRCGPTEWLSLDDYRQVANINLHGLIDVTMTFLPLIKKARGRVVNTASVFGRHSLVGCTPYSISKYGVEAFTDGIRRSLRPYGCQAILIEPGCHKTPIMSKENIERVFRDAWNNASDDVKSEFGEEYFQYKIRTIYESFDKMASGRVEDVVGAYEHALLGRFPRARYVIGTDAIFLWLPVQWLPEWIGDLVLECIGRLDKNRVIPAALRKNT